MLISRQSRNINSLIITAVRKICLKRSSGSSRFTRANNRDPDPYFYIFSLQVLRGRQVFPQEQHDPVPAGLRRRTSRRQRGAAAAVGGKTLRNHSVGQFELKQAARYREDTQVSSCQRGHQKTRDSRKQRALSTQDTLKRILLEIVCSMRHLGPMLLVGEQFENMD